MEVKRIPKNDFDIQITMSKKEALFLRELFNKSPKAISELLGDNHYSADEIADVMDYGKGTYWWSILNEKLGV